MARGENGNGARAGSRRIADARTEALLGPERPPDPAQAAALPRQVEEEDFQERVQLAAYAAPLMIFFLFVLFPLTYYVFRLPGAWPLFAWAFTNLPLIALATLTLRRGRLPLGRGRFLVGKPARRAAFGMLAVSLVLFFGLGMLQALWGWVAPAGW